jgi:hypothetical protein
VADVYEFRRRLGKIFETAFRVEDIAESLISFDAERPVTEILATLQKNQLKVAGVREHGIISGYITTSELDDAAGVCGDHRCEFDDAEVIAADAGLSQTIGALSKRQRLFVTAFGKVNGIVTWTDLQKPSVRMWLFGVITMIEMAFTQMIDTWFPNDGWKRLMTESRLRKAELLLEERRRRNEGGEVRLLDCLQFSDKGQILIKDDDARRVMGMSSKRAGDRLIRDLGSLRDSLAHSQDIVTHGWEVIVTMAERFDEILRFGSTFQVRRLSVSLDGEE